MTYFQSRKLANFCIEPEQESVVLAGASPEVIRGSFSARNVEMALQWLCQRKGASQSATWKHFAPKMGLGGRLAEAAR